MNAANQMTLPCVDSFMTARELVPTLSSSCPVTDAAGRILRRRDIAGFSLTEAVYAAGDFLPRHCHADCFLTLILSGSYTERHTHHEFVWNEGALHLLPAGERHENQFDTAVRMLRVRIEPAAIQRLGEEHARYLSEPHPIAGPMSAWLANRMTREFLAQDDAALLAMEGVLLEMLAENARAASDRYGSSAPGWLRRVRERLEEAYLDAPSLAELAALAGVHPVHLSRQFHKHFGMTIGEYIRKRRIEQASDLLCRSDLSLAQIANACGFSDQSHFCALFKKHSGMTPAKFRDLSGNSSRGVEMLMAAKAAR